MTWTKDEHWLQGKKLKDSNEGPKIKINENYFKLIISMIHNKNTIYKNLTYF